MILFKRNDRNVFFFGRIFLGVIPILLLASGSVFSQQPDVALERRVVALENYVTTFQPTLVELSDNVNRSIQEYTKGLESSLEDYTRKLQQNLDERLTGLNRKAVLLNPFSKTYQSIETNTGTFLIFIKKVESIENGVRLHVNIGNPNFADYQDFTLKFIWGHKWAGEYVMPYQQWRQSLDGTEYTFQGKIKKGKWNAMTVDLVPANPSQLGYLECEMSVSSVELGYN